MRVRNLAFRAACRTWPRHLRESVGPELLDAFERGCASRAQARGRRAASAFAVRAIADALLVGVRERVGSDGVSVDALRRDALHAWRRIRAARSASLATVTLIGLGVGANAAVFSTLQSLRRPPAFVEVDRLVLPRVAIAEAGTDRRDRLWSFAKLLELRARSPALSSIDGYARRFGVLAVPGPADRVPVEFVTAGYFRTLGLEPFAGRFFAPEEDGASSIPDVAVLSHRTWQTRFAGRDAVTGTTIELEGRRVRVVGVAPPGFGGLTGGIELWAPIGQSRATLGNWAMADRDLHWFHAIARMAPHSDVAIARAQTQAAVEASEAVTTRLRGGQRLETDLPRLVDAFSPPVAQRSMQIGLAAAIVLFGVVLLNVWTLQAIRARREARQVAMQFALGATRSSLARTRAIEAALVVLPGAVLGMLLAQGILNGLRAWWFDSLLRGASGDLLLVTAEAFTLDRRVISFGVCLAGLASLVATLAPLRRHCHADPVAALRDATVAGVRPGWRRMQVWIAGAQATLTVMLLVIAGLVVQSLVLMTREQRGFDPDRLLVARYAVPRSAAGSDAATRAFHASARDALRRMPGIASFSLSSSPPLGGGFISSEVEQLPGGSVLAPGQRPPLHVHVVDHNYFSTLGARLLHGRQFLTAETDVAAPIVILSATAADKYLAGRDPVDQQLRFRMNGADPGMSWRVVGVVEDILFGPAARGMRPEAFIPSGVWMPTGLTVLARTTSEPLALVPALRAALQAIDPTVPLSGVTTAETMGAQATAGTRMLVVLLSAFGLIAALVMTTAFWAAIAQAVAERRREIGLRLALGASVRNVQRLLLRAATLPLLLGSLIGLTASAPAATLLQPVLFHVSPNDPLTFAVAALAAVLLGLTASWLPALRIAAIAPSSILRAP